jgi:hypothetical protein
MRGAGICSHFLNWSRRPQLPLYMCMSWAWHAGNAVSLSLLFWLHKKFFLPVRIVRARVLFALADGCEQRAPPRNPICPIFFTFYIRMDLELFCIPCRRRRAPPSLPRLWLAAMIDEIWSEKCVFPNSFQIASARGLYAGALGSSLSHKTPRARCKKPHALSHTENHLFHRRTPDSDAV